MHALYYLKIAGPRTEGERIHIYIYRYSDTSYYIILYHNISLHKKDNTHTCIYIYKYVCIQIYTYIQYIYIYNDNI